MLGVGGNAFWIIFATVPQVVTGEKKSTHRHIASPVSTYYNTVHPWSRRYHKAGSEQKVTVEKRAGVTPQHYILFVYLRKAISNAYYYFAGLKE